MADLDDFFAKKDRKKAKGKKFATTDEVAKKLEETGKRPAEKPKPKEKPANPEGEESQHTEDEDEWKEFEEEKKDYSGLKIGHLTVNDSVDAESDGEGGAFEIGSDGEIVEGGAKHTGPWKKREAVPEAPAAVAAEVVEPTPPAPPAAASSTGSSYKAPHLRNQPTFASPRPRGRNIAPDINSEEYFPTLNSKPPQPNNGSGPWGTRRRREEGAFEEVRNRGGGRSYNVPDSQAKLSLGNKYGALSQDQS
ncbi:protein CDV3 homolog isoform X1 [Temnothorax americanus]|uniref:protein CDV3 homolog isoform X1 n=1 Tax=Temnothorax americanus TaxID=1964332 RepID=UPI004068AA2E